MIGETRGERKKERKKRETQSRPAIRLPPRRKKKLNVALVREQNMAHVTSRGTIGDPLPGYNAQELHSPARYSCSSSITP